MKSLRCRSSCNSSAWVLAAIFTCSLSYCEERVVMSDSVKPLPKVAAASRSANTTPDLTAKVEFMLSLKMRDFPGLLARIGADERIDPVEMAQKYFPLEADYKAALDWLTGQGFTITKTDGCRLCIFAEGTAAQVQQAMQMSFESVEAEGKTYISAATAPSLPAVIATSVLGVNGLQPHIRPHVHSHIVPMKTQKESGVSARGVGHTPPYIPADILQAYNATGLTVSGAGQTIAIVIDTPPLTSDLTAFWAATGVNQSLNNITFIQAVQGTNDPIVGEESLDTEWSSSIAPNAQVRVYVTTTLNDINLDKAYQAIIADLPSQPGMKQVSISLGADETLVPASQMNTDAQLFATMASSGVSVFVSTGDSGASPDGVAQISAPSNDPSVTAVGGTSLFLSSSGSVANEKVWSGSGGGTSTFFSRPAFQTGNGVPAGAFRLTPDISSAADPGTGCLIIKNGQQIQIGGTSWSAPVWAGFCALINEARTNTGKGPAGLLGPQLYPLIGTANFQDITSGSNGLFSATAGYDECTGIGTPNVANLINTLSGSGAFVSGPTIAFSPASGPFGTTVVITSAEFAMFANSPISGFEYTAPLTVSFNGVKAQSMFNSTQVIVQVPAGATTGPISVTTSSGTVMSSTPFTVTAGDVSTLPNLIPFALPGSSSLPGSSDAIDLNNDEGRRLTPSSFLDVTALYVNFGKVTVTTPINVELDVDGAVFDTQNNVLFPTIGPMGFGFVFLRQITSLPVGIHTLTMRIDPGNTITETTKADNVYTRTIEILPDLPTATIVATDSVADATANTPGTFVVTLSAPQSIDTVIGFLTGGSAVQGMDYMPIGNTVTIPAGQTTAAIPVTAMFNAQATAQSTVTLRLMPGLANFTGVPQSATILVKNVAQPIQAYVALKFNFRSLGRDSFIMNGFLPIGTGFMPNGQVLTVTIGGFTTVFHLNSKGSINRTTGKSFALKGHMNAGAFVDAELSFSLKLSNQSLFSALNPDPGFSKSAAGKSVTLPILFLIDSKAFVDSPMLVYKANGNTGTATTP